MLLLNGRQVLLLNAFGRQITVDGTKLTGFFLFVPAHDFTGTAELDSRANVSEASFHGVPFDERLYKREVAVDHVLANQLFKSFVFVFSIRIAAAGRRPCMSKPRCFA